MTDFSSIITDIGLETLSAAKVDEKNIKILNLAVGDGNGAYHEPAKEQTSLVNETYRTAINRIYIDPDNKKQIIIEAAIPSAIGGFFIREVGVFDEQDNLFAVGKYPVTFKPESQSGTGKDIYIRMTLAFSNTPNITIYENPNNAVVSSDKLDALAKIDLSNVADKYKSHQQWPNLQGGNETERFHATQAESATLTQLLSLKTELNANKCIILSSDGQDLMVTDLPAGIPLFTIIQNLSAETPPGMYPLWTGEYIRNCKNLHPGFWEKALEYRNKNVLRVIDETSYNNEISAYGETGAFVINESSGDIRLPKITRFVSSIEQISHIGIPLQDQLQGHWHVVNLRQDSTGVAQAYDDIFGNNGITVGQVDTSQADERILPFPVNLAPGGAVDIITDRVNGVPRVGNETRPKSIRVAQFIQVYNAAIAASMANANQLIGALSSKADITLGNVTGAFTVAAESRGVNGFIKYSDGRCEQWGCAVQTTNGWITTPFHFPFANNEVYLSATCINPSTSGGTPTLQVRYDITRDRFIWHIPNGVNWKCNWYARGVWQ